MSTVYKWQPNTNIKVEAQIAGVHLEKLRKTNNGKLTPEAILHDAKSPKSPIHKAFEWSDTKAAKSYRLWQARHLINSILVIHQPDKAKKGDNIRAFVSVKVEKGRSYTTRSVALSEDDLRLQLLDTAWRELASWRQRHADLDELKPIFALIDKLGADRKAA